jgi:tRNA(Ile)-lysidine synthase
VTNSKQNPAADVQPVSATEFSRLLQGLTPNKKLYKPGSLAVAISGGADSMALTLLAAQWARRRNIPLHALTVDHGLRRGSGSEAKKVGADLKKIGIRHKVLKWQGEKPATNIQAAAREARYDLMLAWCNKNKVADLLLAHHQDDQAETVLLRLIRGSGVDGLAAMASLREVEGVRLLRPFLSLPSARLRATCSARKQDWIEDPSNQNSDFDRIKVRKLMAELTPLGLSAARLAQTANHMARAREALEEQTQELAHNLVSLDALGYAQLDRAGFSAASEEVGLRLLTRCLLSVGGGIYAPRFERLMRLYESLKGKSNLPRQTLAGCQIIVKDRTIRIFRENRNLPVMAIKPGQEILWDRRFHIQLKTDKSDTGKSLDKDLVVGPLGAAGWRAVCQGKDAAVIKSGLAGIPLSARYAFPALWRKETLIAQPWIEMGPDRGPDLAGIDFSVTFSPQNRAKHESFPLFPAQKTLFIRS